MCFHFICYNAVWLLKYPEYKNACISEEINVLLVQFSSLFFVWCYDGRLLVVNVKTC